MNILITGAGRGLGYELTAEALKRGHGVIAGVRNPIEAQAALSHLAVTYGDKLTVATLDVTDEEGIAELATKLNGEGRTLGAIINNAAILTARNTTIEELDLQDMLTTMDINLYGPIRVVKHFLHCLLNQNYQLSTFLRKRGA